MAVLALALACIVLWLVLRASLPARFPAGLVVGPAIASMCAGFVFADGLLLVKAAHPVLFAGRAVPVVLLVLMCRHLYSEWVEFLCETWLIASAIVLIAMFAVTWTLPVDRGTDAETHILAVAMSLFMVVNLERVAATHIRRGVTRVALRAFLVLRLLAVLLATASEMGLGDGIDTWVAVSLVLAYICLVVFLVTTFRAPDQFFTAPRAALSPTVPFILAGLVVLVDALAFLEDPRFDRWSVVVLTAVSAAALLARQVMTHLKLVESTQQAQRLERHYRSLVQDSTDVIVLAHPAGRLEYVSPAAERVLTGDAAAATTVAELVGASQPDVDAAFADCIATGRGRLDGRRDGQALEAAISQRDDDFVLSVRDVTEREHMRASLHSLAFNDPLTGLANRDRLVQDVELLIRSGAGDLHALFIDLDRFKQINDASGHRAGDAVLGQVAARLREGAPASALVARLGGDEFVVVDSLAPGRATDLAQDLHRTLSRPFRVDEKVYPLGASIGIAQATPGVDAEELVRRADIAMVAAKRGNQPVRRFEVSMSQSVRAQADLDNDLAQTWSRHSVLVHLQPIVSVRTLEVRSTEALLRWRAGDGSIQSPAPALAYAERTGQLATLTGWVVEKVLAQVSRTPTTTTPIAVNMPPTVLLEPDFAAGLAARVASLGIPPTRINLELTEEAVVEHGRAGIRALRALHDEGFHIHIDDFGTGFSSLSYLIRLPVDGLKIDRSFTRELTTSPAARSVVHGLVQFSREVGIDLVAEGVEREAEHRALAELGVPYAQGFWYGRPEASADIADRAELVSWTSGRREIPPGALPRRNPRALPRTVRAQGVSDDDAAEAWSGAGPAGA